MIQDLVSALSLVLAVPGVLVGLVLLLGRGSRGGVYIWRTRKPGALLGWPIIGRHFGYVGETSSFRHRKRQHSGKPLPYDPYASTGALWSDLAPRCYEIPLPGKWVRKAAEWILIKILFPVYNVKYNGGNPRRISRYRQVQMRTTRNKQAHRPTPITLGARLVGALRWYHLAGTVILMAVGIGWVG
jgi:hypothetical protein